MSDLLPDSRMSSAPLDENAKELARLLRVPESAAAILLAVGFNECRERVKESLSARSGVGVDAAAVDRALHARVPGGAEVWHWLPQTDDGKPHETARNVIGCALTAALTGEKK